MLYVVHRMWKNGPTWQKPDKLAVLCTELQYALCILHTKYPAYLKLNCFIFNLYSYGVVRGNSKLFSIHVDFNTSHVYSFHLCFHEVIRLCYLRKGQGGPCRLKDSKNTRENMWKKTYDVVKSISSNLSFIAWKYHFWFYY